MTRLTKASPWLVLLVSFLYYSLLSSKIFTWIFASSDAGDWLSLSNVWMTPQPFGSPLYISLVRLIGLFPGNHIIELTILLSCLPSAITVTLVYLITKHLISQKSRIKTVIKATNGIYNHTVYRLKTPQSSLIIPIITSLVLLASTLFLTQSTVLEEYALSTMLLTFGLYYLIKDRIYTGFIFLGLATLVHITILPIAFIIWFIYLYKWASTKSQGWKLIKLGITYTIFGILPYAFILLLMYLPTPRIYAGTLNWTEINQYFLGAAHNIVGTISVFDFPGRLSTFIRIIVVSLGLAVIPLFYFFTKPRNPSLPILLAPLVFSIWYYLTCLDPSTWTFLIFGFPSLAIMVGIGLSKLKPAHLKLNLGLITTSCLVLLLTNGVLLNANSLAKEQPWATNYLEELNSLENGSAVVVAPGPFSMALVYKITEGKNLIPIISGYTNQGFDSYLDYLKDEWGLTGNTTTEIAENAMNQGKTVYIAYQNPEQMEELKWFNYSEMYGYKFVKIVTGFIPSS